MKGQTRPTPWAVGLGLIISGVLVAVVAVLADVIGLGATRGYYGHYQFIATVAGLSMLVLGVAVLLSTVREDDV